MQKILKIIKIIKPKNNKRILNNYKPKVKIYILYTKNIIKKNCNNIFYKIR